jgi:hypothetical protein
VMMGHGQWRDAHRWQIGSTIARTSGKSGWVRARSTPYQMVLRPDKDSPLVSSWAEAAALTARLNGWKPTDPDAIQGDDLTYYWYSRGALLLAAYIGVKEAEEPLRWIDGQLRARQAKIPYKWRLI